MRIAAFIPALDEEALVAGAVANARAALGAAEVVVVDACSGDATAAVAASAGATVLRHAGPRGSALNAAIAASDADVVAILHADTRLAEDAGAAIRAALADPAVAGGAFRLAFDRPGAVLALAAAGANLRTRAFGVAYGDQALFARRSAFDAVGGFPPWPLWDDAALCRRLAAEGRLALLDGPAVTSARRHVATGPLRTCARVWWLTARFRLGTSPERLARAWPARREPGGIT